MACDDQIAVQSIQDNIISSVAAPDDSKLSSDVVVSQKVAELFPSGECFAGLLFAAFGYDVLYTLPAPREVVRRMGWFARHPEYSDQMRVVTFRKDCRLTSDPISGPGLIDEDCNISPR